MYKFTCIERGGTLHDEHIIFSCTADNQADAEAEAAKVLGSKPDANHKWRASAIGDHKAPNSAASSKKS